MFPENFVYSKSVLVRGKRFCPPHRWWEADEQVGGGAAGRRSGRSRQEVPRRYRKSVTPASVGVSSGQGGPHGIRRDLSRQSRAWPGSGEVAGTAEGETAC